MILPNVNLASPEWMERALCVREDPELWFPLAISGPASENRDGLKHTRAAKAVCGTCPVSVACLTYALENDERWGIWGGLTADERQGLGES